MIGSVLPGQGHATTCPATFYCVLTLRIDVENRIARGLTGASTYIELFVGARNGFDDLGGTELPALVCRRPCATT